MRTKTLRKQYHKLVIDLPNFHKSGSIKGMKRMYYGTNSLLVKCGSYIYNVTSKPEIYFNLAK